MGGTHGIGVKLSVHRQAALLPAQLAKELLARARAVRTRRVELRRREFKVTPQTYRTADAPRSARAPGRHRESRRLPRPCADALLNTGMSCTGQCEAAKRLTLRALGTKGHASLSLGDQPSQFTIPSRSQADHDDVECGFLLRARHGGRWRDEHCPGRWGTEQGLFLAGRVRIYTR